MRLCELHIHKKMAALGSKCRKSAPTAEGSTSGNARRFVPAWKTTFPWVFLDERKVMRCQYCTDAGKANTFTRRCDKMH